MSSSLSLFLSLSLYLFYLILFYTRLPSRGETLVADFKLTIDSFFPKNETDDHVCIILSCD